MGEAHHSSRTKPLYRGTQIVWYITGLLEALLAFRFILKLLGAQATAGFTSFIYGITRPFVAPFMNVFGITPVVGNVLEWTTLLAMLVYWLIAWGISRLLVMSRSVSTSEAADKLGDKEK